MGHSLYECSRSHCSTIPRNSISSFGMVCVRCVLLCYCKVGESGVAESRICQERSKGGSGSGSGLGLRLRFHQLGFHQEKAEFVRKEVRGVRKLHGDMEKEKVIKRGTNSVIPFLEERGKKGDNG